MGIVGEGARAGRGGDPFNLEDGVAFRRWRAWKLADYPRSLAQLTVPIADPRHPSPAERAAVLRACRKANLVIYELAPGPPADKAAIAALGTAFGLQRLDGNLCADDDRISSVRVTEAGRHQGYIPYTNRALNWHTDGYYNAPQERIGAILMHCASDAASGGENALLDHEILYLLLRDEDPAHVRALMAPDAMTIPPNVESGALLRDSRTGPVFSVDPTTGSLHMRYTARRRNIRWKDDPATRAAVECLERLLEEARDFTFRHRLRPGQGILCNNVLHRREAFTDDVPAGRTRLMFRARYYDRIAGTAPTAETWGEERQCCG